MTATTARWWLWVCLTAVGAVIAGMFGFFRVLATQDATYLGFTVLALYAACTAWLGWKIRTCDTDYRFVEHVAKTMSYLGILGTFIGLAMAFQAMAALPADGSIPATFKADFLHGVTTKFLTSIVGLIGFICLEMQVRILEVGERPAGVHVNDVDVTYFDPSTFGEGVGLYVPTETKMRIAPWGVVNDVE